jgi:hypothetical protein
MQDSLAKTLVSLANKRESLKELDQVFTEKSCVLLASLDQDSYSWKMSPQLKATDLTRYSKTWPSWGMTQDGFAYAHPMWGRTTTETDGSFWPTPTTDGYKGEGQVQMLAKMCISEKEYRQMAHRTSEARKQKYWTTPTAHNAKETNAPSESLRNTPTLTAQAGGQLNPMWIEWLMGFPIGFTVLKDWVTPKSRSKRQPRLPSWLRG